MINQLGLNQYVNTMSQYSAEQSDRIREADSDIANVMRIKQQVAKIDRETEFIKDNGGSAPPTWKLDYIPRLNVI